MLERGRQEDISVSQADANARGDRRDSSTRPLLFTTCSSLPVLLFLFSLLFNLLSSSKEYPSCSASPPHPIQAIQSLTAFLGLVHYSDDSEPEVDGPTPIAPSPAIASTSSIVCRPSLCTVPHDEERRKSNVTFFHIHFFVGYVRLCYSPCRRYAPSGLDPSDG
jgi:hypothetical protein